MRNKSGKFLAAMILGAAAMLVSAFAAFAANAPVYSVTWDAYTGEGTTVYWESGLVESGKKPKFKVTLYRGRGDRMSNAITTEATRYDFTTIIADKGTGQYYVTVSVSGNSAEPVKSDVIVVDGNMLNQMKKYLKNLAAETEFSPGQYGWIRFPGNVWKYRNADGQYATGWLLNNGQWYYLSDNGTMLTGWQIINNRWYCFNASGAMYYSTVTPDGITVDGSGAAVSGGVPLDASWQPKNNEISSNKTLTVLESIKITSNESKAEPYVVRPMRVTSNGKFSVEKYSFSVPYEKWEAGVPVIVTCELSAYTGYSFGDNMKVTFNRGTLVSNTGDSVERTVVYRYYPRFVLPSPGNVFLDESDVLHWSTVNKASRYVVTILHDGVSEGDLYLKTNQLDLSDFRNGQELGVKITAIAAESMRNYYYDSFSTDIPDVDVMKITKGTVTSFGNRIRYVDELGRLAEGWAQINGQWYHFTKGLSELPGWYKDADLYWYYFDNSSQMRTGYVTDKGVAYFLNDGSVEGIPLGAWVEGK